MILDELLSSNEENLIQYFTKSYFLNILLEGYKKNIIELLKDFYGASYSLNNETMKYENKFLEFNPENENAYVDADFVVDKKACNTFENEVFRTEKNNQGKYDKDKSLYGWLVSRDIISENDLSILISIRDSRNEIIHEFTRLIEEEVHEIDQQIKQLLEIMDKTSKNWIEMVELPAILDANELYKKLLEYMFSNNYWHVIYNRINKYFEK